MMKLGVEGIPGSTDERIREAFLRGGTVEVPVGEVAGLFAAPRTNPLEVLCAEVARIQPLEGRVAVVVNAAKDYVEARRRIAFEFGPGTRCMGKAEVALRGRFMEAMYQAPIEVMADVVLLAAAALHAARTPTEG